MSALGMGGTRVLESSLDLYKGVLSKLRKKRPNFVGSGLAQQLVLDFSLCEIETKNSTGMLVGNFEEGEGVVKLHNICDLALINPF